MDYHVLRGTGLYVSSLCIGTEPFGAEAPLEESARVVDMAVEAGVNFIDTADLYRKTRSEAAVGKVLKGRRDRFIVATKLGIYQGPGINDRGLSRYHIVKGIEDSLRRLQTDWIDLLYMHQPDYVTPVEETLEAMTVLVRSGKVRYFGVSNHAAWQMADMIAESEKRCLIAPCFAQMGYNLLARGLEQEFVPFADKHQVGIIVYQPLAAGLLTGKHSRSGPVAGSRLDFDKQHHDRYWNDANFDAIDKYAQVAADCGFTLTELALKWCLSRPFVSSTLVGVRTPEQMAKNLKAADDRPLPEEAATRCDAIYLELMGSHFVYNR